MVTLNEMANKLQKYIIDSESSGRNISSTNFNTGKYNNIKLIMDESVNDPHIKIRIGMSEATYSLKDKTRTDGGLGPDEKYVRKWLDNSLIISDLNDIYKKFKQNLLQGKVKNVVSDDYAIELDAKGRIKRIFEAKAAQIKFEKTKSKESREEIRQKLKNYLKSIKRYLK